MSFLKNINPQILSSTDLAIYNYIMTHMDEIGYMRVRDLALASHTSTASVIRFIRKIGFDTYPEFRTMIRKKHQTPLKEVSSEDYFQEIREITDPASFSADMEKSIAALSDAIMECENLIFCGIGFSGIMAQYAALRMTTLGFNSFAVTDPYYPLVTRLMNTSDNVIVAISNSGKSSDIIEMMTFFQSLPDYTLAAITGNIDSTLARMSSIVFTHQYVEERKYGYYDDSSQIPTMLIIERLVKEIGNRLMKDSL